MADLSTTRNYDDGQVLVRADLDAFLDDIETFVNVTKLNDDNIQNSGITGSTKLLNQSVTEPKIASAAISTLKLQDASVTTAKIVDANVTTAKIASANITTALIADANVTTAKIASQAITTALLALNSVDDTILSSDPSDDTKRAVGTDAIHDQAVTAAKIAAGSIDTSKLATNFASGTFSGGSGSYSVGSTVTTSGRPVCAVIYSGTVTASTSLALVRNDGSSDTTIGNMFFTSDWQGLTYNFSFVFVENNPTDTNSRTSGAAATIFDMPAAGTYTYKLSATTTGSLSNVKMIVYEL